MVRDVIVAQGQRGRRPRRRHVDLAPLVPQVADVVNGVPVLAAGGIADGAASPQR
jgi:NAD(P)H-dependent flavin oxidoreductase YrpB (nitropropane dioxygenase family)